MCFIEKVKSYDELIEHKRKFDDENMTETGFQKLLVCSKSGVSYNLYLKDQCCVLRAQLNVTVLTGICMKPHTSEFYSHSMNLQVRLEVVRLVQEMITKCKGVNVSWKFRSSDGV